jgi:phage repressor protein C with HTH and peptisase S24 domain
MAMVYWHRSPKPMIAHLTAALIAAVTANSPTAQVTSPVEALESAEAYVHAHPGADYLFGNGDSMLPLYHDRAVVVVERPAMSELKVGQTIVFMGRNGVPVAHVLIRTTRRGWVTMGLGNSQEDPGTVSEDAFIGVVVKAYQPTGSAVLAYLSSPQQRLYASNP